MSRTQASLIVLACFLAAAWAARRAGPALSADARPGHILTWAAPLPAHGILAEADRLRAHLASPPPFQPPTRNPFRFHEPPAPPPRLAGKTVSPASSTPVDQRPERPEMSLVGIAEETGPDGTVRRTAIVSAMLQLFFAKEGERVLGRYEVVRVTPDAAQLREPGGDVFTLALR